MSWSIEQQDLWHYGPPEAGSLGFVRVVRDGDRRAVLVLDPEDNPGRGPVNAAEALLDEVNSAFGPTPTFTCFPWLDGDDAWTEIARPGAEVEFKRHSRRTIAAQFGAVAELPAPDACRCEQLAPGHLLLTRIRPVVEEPSVFETLGVVDVAALPWPHNPGRCAHQHRFLELERSYPPEANQVAAAHWFLSLDAGDAADCPAHRADWLGGAAAAVTVLEAGTSRERQALLAALDGLAVPETAKRAAATFFLEPMAWTPGTATLANGQHRSCALKLAGAPRCVVDLSDKSADREPRTPRARATEEVVAHWGSLAAAPEPKISA